jgi:hypothetical protein
MFLAEDLYILKRLGVSCRRFKNPLGLCSGCEWFAGPSVEELVDLLIFEELLKLEKLLERFSMKHPSSNIEKGKNVFKN